MAQVFLSLGSNNNCEYYLRRALTELATHFGKLDCSSVYRSPPVDDIGDDYSNMAVGFYSTTPVSELVDICKAIENSLGRKRQTTDNNSGNKAVVTIDIDVLLVGNNVGRFAILENTTLVLPHADIESYSHVLIPLVELAASYIHPRLKISLQQLLKNKKISPLEKVEFALTLEP